MLLSDGQANKGLTDVNQIAADCAEMANAGVGTSTYGLSTRFNEDLMTAMARSGRGNAYYGQTAQDLMDPFQEEFDLLQALFARKLRLTLKPADGVKARVMNGYVVDRTGAIVMPDLAYDGEAWALIELTVSKDLTVDVEGPVTVLKALLEFEDIEGRKHDETARLVLPPVPAAAFEAIAPDPTVTSRAAELQAAKLQEEARVAARRGDWQRVKQIMERLEAQSRNSPWLAATLDSLRVYAQQRRSEEFSKEALYKSHKMRNRLASFDEIMPWSAEREASKAAFLRRKIEQGRRFDNPDKSGDGNEMKE